MLVSGRHWRVLASFSNFRRVWQSPCLMFSCLSTENKGTGVLLAFQTFLQGCGARLLKGLGQQEGNCVSDAEAIAGLFGLGCLQSSWHAEGAPHPCAIYPSHSLFAESL